ncbi:MAG: family 10 glycosylhydrolase [Cyanobacteria bacterium SID2]|nr:family 10 glycosylhydrolase [Cyanobacteria bacterium SID2]MBP0002371.1 family 10 glycosylhydrolase [Cyanobacteria bacterium SBC]
MFSDLERNWAKPFIEALAERGIVRGFPDGTFRPEQPMTRAQFAALLRQAFDVPNRWDYIPFTDVPSNHWARDAVRKAYAMGFLAGYPGNRFRPNQQIPKVQILVSLVSGLRISGDKPRLSDYYRDADAVPNYAIDRAAIATEAGLVANYPDIHLLTPNKPATRAEVAVLVYQALVATGRAGEIDSSYLVKSPLPEVDRVTTVRVSHTREFRGLWVASVWNINWPSRRDLSVDRQKSELLAILDRASQLNFNAIVLQVRPEGDALYASDLEPWSFWLTGEQGKAPSPYYDPLEFAIEEAHKRNLELHAWFNPYRARTSSQIVPVAPHAAVRESQFVYTYGSSRWMDPGAKAIQDRTYAVILDVVNRYDIDGVHLDDYFYPYPISGTPFPDAATYQRYRNAGGWLSLADWRRDRVNQMVKRLYEGIRSTKPHVKFGISPFGIYRPGQPPQAQGFDQYEGLYADPLKWMQEGSIDYIAPQLYWRIDQAAQSYPMLLRWWVQNNEKLRHVYAGNNLVKLGESGWSIDEFLEQIRLTRDLSGQLALGNIFYQVAPLMENRDGINSVFQKSLYRRPALTPVMSWKGTSAPPLPAKVEINNRTLRWKVQGETPKAWTLYRQIGTDIWEIERIVPGEVLEIQIDRGTFALCAVDRLNNESRGVVVRRV